MSSNKFNPRYGATTAASRSLASCLEGFDSWLANQGYAPGTRQAKLRLVGEFSHWLDERDLDLSEGTQIDAWFGEPGKRPRGASTTGRQLRA